MSLFRFIRSTRVPASLCAALLCSTWLAGCGGGAFDAMIGGALTGLNAGASVTVQNNNADNVTLTTNQSFSFATSIAPGGTYSVTVLTQPVGENCTVTNGAGTVDSFGDDVSNVAVTCALTSSVGGTVSGLAVGNSVWLSSAGQLLPIAANGAFAIPGVLAAGTGYSVTVAAQPAQQTCTILNGSGTVVAGVMASVLVTCN